MKENNPCIYKITNLINGKVYIGQTKNDFNKRKNSHTSALRRNKHSNFYLQKSWNKYGESAFNFEKIINCSQKELDFHERYCIVAFESLVNQKGYNLESGGNNYKEIHESTRLKISNRMKVWAIKSGHIERLAESNRGDKSHHAKEVVLVNTGETFGSVKSANEKYPHVSRGNIQSCCCKKTHGAGKMEDGTWMVWEYKENYNPSKEYQFTKNKNDKNKYTKSVICINTKEIFTSLEEACLKYNLSKPGLVRACKGERKTFGKLENGERLQWSYYEEDKIYDLEDFSYINDLLESNKVTLINTGEIFNTIGEASRKYNLTVSQISNCCKGKAKSAGKGENKEKLKWSFYNEHL